MVWQFNKGFFAGSKKSEFAKFDSVNSLALVYLAAAIKGKPELAPAYFGGRPYFHCHFDGEGRTYDNRIFRVWRP